MTCQLYLITPPSLDPVDFAPRLDAALTGGPVACVQLRLKGGGDDDVRRAAEALMPICVAHDVAFLINDRPDLAAEMGADGVHIGQDDGDYARARRTVGADRIIGVTCHDSRHLAMVAAEAGADYVAFGAFFPTATKQPKSTADIDILKWWGDLMEVPCVAIGGITEENCAPLVRAGADFLAVVHSVWSHQGGPAAGVAALHDAIALARFASPKSSC